MGVSATGQMINQRLPVWRTVKDRERKSHRSSILNIFYKISSVEELKVLTDHFKNKITMNEKIQIFK